MFENSACICMKGQTAWVYSSSSSSSAPSLQPFLNKMSRFIKDFHNYSHQVANKNSLIEVQPLPANEVRGYLM